MGTSLEIERVQDTEDIKEGRQILRTTKQRHMPPLQPNDVGGGSGRENPSAATAEKTPGVLKRALQWADVDGAVFWGAATRVWFLAATPLTLLVVAAYFTPQLQGYFYTFTSLLSLQILGELGLGQVISTFVSHEWASLGLDKSGSIIGNPKALSRLRSLWWISLKWYGMAAVVISVVLGMVGYVIFSQKPSDGIEWVAPWIFLCAFAGVIFFLTPVWSILEGCHQVAQVNFFRFVYHGIVSVSWLTAIPLGLGLWSLALATAVGAVWSLVFLQRNYANFFKSLFRSPLEGSIDWRNEAWPMQWRVATSAASYFFASCVFTPIMFHFHGPIIAGQTGMTLALKDALASISIVWAGPKYPQFCSLVVKGEYRKLNQMFWRMAKIIGVFSVSAAMAIGAGVYILSGAHPSIISRFLPMPATFLFLAAQVVNNMTVPMVIYLRAHKQEPILFLSIAVGISVIASNMLLGNYYGATGMALGYFLISVLSFPFLVFIWRRRRQKWH